MTTSRPIRAPLWATLLAALVAAMLSYFVFVPSGEAAQVSDKQAYEPRIINGTSVPDGKYPFMAALVDTRIQGTFSDKLICGGSLIDKTHVLTAGHCVLTAQQTGPPAPSITPQALQVSVGRTVLNSDQGVVRNAKDIDVYPAYQGFGSSNQRYDAAVLTLSRPVKGIEPIELATSSQNDLERPRRQATVAGWGNTVANAKPGDEVIANRMLETQLTILSDSRADKILEPPRWWDYAPPLQIAAGGPKSKSITCQGDSGGPLFVRTSNGDGDNGDDKNRRGTNGAEYTQIGIISYGPIGCLTANRIAVFTEVNAKPIEEFIERAADLDDGDDGDDDK